ncbi:MAG: hypothetical protein ACJ77A_00195 [Actinomycetota bacterium]
MIAGTWYVDRTVAALFLVAVATLVLALGGLFREGWRLKVGLPAAAVAVAAFVAWGFASHAGPGPEVAGTMMPWNNPPATIWLDCTPSGGCQPYGQESGTPDPRSVPCHPLERAVHPVGHIAGLFGGPPVVVDARNDVFVEVKDACYLTYNPWI